MCVCKSNNSNIPLLTKYFPNQIDLKLCHGNSWPLRTLAILL